MNGKKPMTKVISASVSKDSTPAQIEEFARVVALVGKMGAEP